MQHLPLASEHGVQITRTQNTHVHKNVSKIEKRKEKGSRYRWCPSSLPHSCFPFSRTKVVVWGLSACHPPLCSDLQSRWLSSPPEANGRNLSLSCERAQFPALYYKMRWGLTADNIQVNKVFVWREFTPNSMPEYTFLKTGHGGINFNHRAGEEKTGGPLNSLASQPIWNGKYQAIERPYFKKQDRTGKMIHL